MTKVWLMATKTYRQYLRSATFLILTFGVPLLMMIAGAVPFISMSRGGDEPVGYVDQTGRLALAQGSETGVTAYDSLAAAETALAQNQIEGYLVVPTDYFQGERPTYHSTEAPGFAGQQTLTRLMRQVMLTDQPAWLLDRLEEPAHITYVARETGETVTAGFGLIVHIATPMVLAILFALSVLTGAGQMGQAVIQEKEQRSMEMVITSLAPWQLVTGKVLGITLLTMTQVTAWLVAGAIGLGLAWRVYGEGQPITLPWPALMWGILLAIPSYFLYAVLAAGLGIIAGGRQQARQLSSFLGFIGLMPLYLLGMLVNNLEGPLALGLTWFPLTAPIIALVRMTLSQVPTWQLIVSLAILLVSLIGGIWGVARIFRAAMLMYGQSLRPGEIWQALRRA